jgi:poly-beta-1,6-N-acetyl-D-glucosamine synthase
VSYVVVTPVRDEEQHLSTLASSMTAQTRPPDHWVLVDDGSTDRTPGIVDGLAACHQWITAVHRPDRGIRAPGGGVVEAFHAGLSAAGNGYDYLVKLDADLEFEPDYFERCLGFLDGHTDYGVVGGLVHNRQADGSLVIEKHPLFHVRGATKIYRRATWLAIGGLVPAKGWDTVDEVKANQLGWRTTTLVDVPIVQQRNTGARTGTWRDWSKNGRAAHFCGYHPLFVLVRAVRVSGIRPLAVRGLALLSGYFGAVVDRAPRIDDRELVAYTRRQQLRRLTHRPTIWR